MRLFILCLSSIKIASLLVMLKQFLLLLRLYERFLGRIAVLLRQPVMVGIGRALAAALRVSAFSASREPICAQEASRPTMDATQ